MKTHSISLALPGTFDSLQKRLARGPLVTVAMHPCDEWHIAMVLGVAGTIPDLDPAWVRDSAGLIGAIAARIDPQAAEILAAWIEACDLAGHGLRRRLERPTIGERIGRAVRRISRWIHGSGK
jgi:hypothetical protein